MEKIELIIKGKPEEGDRIVLFFIKLFGGEVKINKKNYEVKIKGFLARLIANEVSKKQ